MGRVITCLCNHLSDHFGDKNGKVESGVQNQSGQRTYFSHFINKNGVLSLNIYELNVFLKSFVKVENRQYTIDTFSHIITGQSCCRVCLGCFISFSAGNKVHIELW